MMDDRAEAERFAILDTYGLMDTPPEPHLDAIVREAAAELGTEASTITLVDGQRQWFKARVGVAASETPIADSICAHVVRQGRPLVVDDTAADPRFAAMNGVGEDGWRFYAGVPLTLHDGVRVGTLCVLDTAARGGLADGDLDTLSRLARRTVAAFEASRAIAGGAGIDPITAADAVWVERAAAWLEQAGAALDRVGAGAASAHLEQVIAMVDALRVGGDAEQRAAA